MSKLVKNVYQPPVRTKLGDTVKAVQVYEGDAFVEEMITVHCDDDLPEDGELTLARPEAGRGHEVVYTRR